MEAIDTREAETMTVSDFLTEFRPGTGLTQQAFAEHCGVPRSSYWVLESGYGGDPFHSPTLTVHLNSIMQRIEDFRLVRLGEDDYVAVSTDELVVFGGC